MRYNGIVKFWAGDRGFGFLRRADGQGDVFVHITALTHSGVAKLNEGDKVSFEIEDDRGGRGKMATNVQIEERVAAILP